MPALIEEDISRDSSPDGVPSSLPFGPITKAHILHCSYHSWWPKYRTISPKARLVPLTQPFVEYLRADGIVLPDDENDGEVEWSDDSGVYTASDDQDDEEVEDVAADWRPVHKSINDTIASLGGKATPKLNWSAPKDATWMNANSMDCRTANDVYLLLKSSDFITHDLEHAYDDTEEEEVEAKTELTQATIPFHLVLRKSFDLHPSLEFRCFVRNRKMIALCQRDLNHFDFLFDMQDHLRSRIQEFFDVRLRDTFEDADFVFDVYVPPPHERVWLIDVNPWAPRTDPLLFSWLELLQLEEPPEREEEFEWPEMTIRVPFRPAGEAQESSNATTNGMNDEDRRNETKRIQDILDANSDSDSDVDDELWLPEFRLVRKSDPEAYSFSTPQYSAHKLPKDVVDASQSGEGLREFARDWQQLLDKRKQDEAELADGSDTD
ncbi:hypothetical protein B0A48_14155 [Cryoendolithus antarcticus]|uniref:Uncharacterized protein n=1 Tax=Cryoendolithus antarcticus TaxID=1507870 RepID=A0A1V8SLX1_9PEZI|nr:hypothetical protein B0A48_14155 [Cryoendolithus antarcticus]